ncbi:hypothetical protein CR513_33922, partial [Mucuna pruriens]
MSSKTSKSMVWHAKETDNNEMMRHPRDFEDWKKFDLTYPDFASDPRNISSDGFNPFGTLSSNISPRTRNDIDIYIQPLIKELKELWENGVETNDASRDEMFTLQACLLWTVSEFIGLGMLSGWNTYIGLAFPSCNFDSSPLRLPFSKK